MRNGVGLAVLASAAALIGTSEVRAQTEPDFGTRSPRACPKITSKPTPTQAAVLVQCRLESKRNLDIVLYEKVKVEMGGPQPYNYKAHSMLTGVDTTSKVYPIRGSMVYYDCDSISGNHDQGHNCRSNNRPAAEGYCWKTTFGDWNCSMQDYTNVTTDIRSNLPPP